MRRLIIKSNGNQGASLIEILIALTALTILSVPLVMSFTNSMWTTKKSMDQIELNSVTRIVRQNVVNSIKGSSVFGTSIYLRVGNTFNPGSNVPVYDLEGNLLEDYRFNATNPVFCADTNKDGTINNNDRMVRYLVVLLKRQPNGSFKEIRKFKVEANTLSS